MRRALAGGQTVRLDHFYDGGSFRLIERAATEFGANRPRLHEFHPGRSAASARSISCLLSSNPIHTAQTTWRSRQTNRLLRFPSCRQSRFV